MELRKCAMESHAFQKLKYYYEHREDAAITAKTSGKKIIGTLGCDVPEEIILAAGMMSIPIYAMPDGNLKLADKYLEYAFDPMVRAQFEKIVDGSYNNLLDAVVISNSTDVLIRIYLYLKELKRKEPDVSFPDIYFIDWLFTRKRMHQERNRFTISLFIEEMEKLSGVNITEESIQTAAAIINETKSLLRKLNSLRNASDIRITGTEMLIITGAGLFMEKEHYNILLNELLSDVKNWPCVTGKRVFYTGSVQTDITLYKKIEKLGAVIVGEDHDWGERYYDRDYDLSMPAIRALVDEYMLREYSSKKAFVSQRIEALNREVNKSGADGVIFFFHIYEEAASWDYPEQKVSLEERGIHTVEFSKIHWPSTNEELIDFDARIKAFIVQEE